MSSATATAATLLCLALAGVFAQGPEEYLDIQKGGSYRFGYKTGDPGGHYHHVESNGKGKEQVVNGRYGFRDPENPGRELTVEYTAGNRGFRARGPHIHRKMDLAQGGPYYKDSPDYADPNDDPSYEFQFNKPGHSRHEVSDRNRNITGNYQFIDDVGDIHRVAYEAGAGKGFIVNTYTPDNDAEVPPNGGFVRGKTPPGKPARGKAAILTKKDGSYRFLTAGPDQAREEIRSAAGYVRGFYTYRDDRGQLRKTEYIAGPETGYKVIQTSLNGKPAPGNFPDGYPSPPFPPPSPPFPIPPFPPLTPPTGGDFGPGTIGVSPGGSRPGGDLPGTVGTSPDGVRPGGTRPGGTRPGGTRPGGTRPGGTRPGGSRPGGTKPIDGGGGGENNGSPATYPGTGGTDYEGGDGSTGPENGGGSDYGSGGDGGGGDYTSGGGGGGGGDYGGGGGGDFTTSGGGSGYPSSQPGGTGGGGNIFGPGSPSPTPSLPQPPGFGRPEGPDSVSDPFDIFGGGSRPDGDGTGGVRPGSGTPVRPGGGGARPGSGTPVRPGGGGVRPGTGTAVRPGGGGVRPGTGTAVQPGGGVRPGSGVVPGGGFPDNGEGAGGSRPGTGDVDGRPGSDENRPGGGGGSGVRPGGQNGLHGGIGPYPWNPCCLFNWNKGDKFTFPKGVHVRAHVQSLDIVPVRERQGRSPGAAAEHHSRGQVVTSRRVP